jgi:hypothetical protein
MAALFFVDDTIICETSMREIEELVTHLKKKFELCTLPVCRSWASQSNETEVKEC